MAKKNPNTHGAKPVRAMHELKTQYALDFFQDRLNALKGEERRKIKLMAPERSRALWAIDSLNSIPSSASAPEANLDISVLGHSDKALGTRIPMQPRTLHQVLGNIDSTEYPLQQVVDADIFLPEIVSAPDAYLQGIGHLGLEEFQHARIFQRGRSWLSSLPIKTTEKIYLAKGGPRYGAVETLILPWGLFVDHWPLFACNTSMMNIVNEDRRWFLFQHHDNVFIFGCTYLYALQHTMPLDTFLVSPANYSVIGLIDNFERYEYYDQLEQEYLEYMKWGKGIENR